MWMNHRNNNNRNMIATVGAALLCVTTTHAEPPTLSQTSAATPPVNGVWRAWLDSPGGPLPFRLGIIDREVRWNVWIVNGSEKIPVPSVKWNGKELVMSIDLYDSKITAKTSENGTRLDGEWVKRAAGGKALRGGDWTHMPFHAIAGEVKRFAPTTNDAEKKTTVSFAGRWSVRFDSSNDPALAIFEDGKDGLVTGTFLTTTGDYRYLAGDVTGNRLRLSTFDGAHAFLFDARMQPDGTIKGDFWSRDTWHDTWTARRDDKAVMPDAFKLTRFSSNARLGSLSFPDLKGKKRSLTDPEFVGKARIIVIFGTWCPNCNDATRFFVELDRKYRERGLRILGLAFELTGELDRDTRQVALYAKRHRIGYPVLVAGVSDKAKASQALPILDRVRSYPTTIFLDAAGKVRAIHTGFSGPATGDEYTKLRDSFEKLIEELLAES